ncbi:flagellar motility protein MotE (MotC chaperone) [Dyadobacter sp. BE34]|uniref:Flagellar motility protein MotE (MotC chaperone) n=1 Tax=Dyadobacter fermentans TaxID=94254 RepID=A0ABU1QX16_9BACT|nr:MULTISPECIES: hypothetical protein [Dyadobacter]MDR6805692.1 flagellar motility protein MotE (MotC chaperone) [Dyadobacter fermentans]MDR7042548.1 flagellar motility protein MotE (MotC chaperone) [Dyadobacter sp. BE242]MDR7196860.1 flagellar motility protein MotE (MotC chaperone) [Dyadobacter sp. BE34]MDR7215705.1 flagellar motility protein MotE (MotC chaperone) [Dyadobacter sp. BE31]MDR7263241.1 flagellar motility protein MotE (MotC chaperone) [Dyadobacter sp. BE32]
MADSEPGIGKKILSFFIKDADETAPAAQAPKPAAASPAPEPSKPAPATVTNAAGTGQIDKKFTEHFVNLLEKANLPGPDYFEYKQALQSMEGLGLGEEKQFQAAWASFKAMGGAKDTTVLKTSADQYLTILVKDRESFLKDVEKAIKERVGALQDEHQKLEQTNAAYAQQIVDLQKKIDDNKNRLGQIAGEVSEQTAKINTNKDSFEVTYVSFVDQIQSDLAKINQYLQ